jgi:hypothetical protein
MGILRNGYYTRGYKNETEIGNLTGMKTGDTVFDTTNSFRRIYDGFNWVSGNQISLETRGIPSGGNQSNGAISRPSTLIDSAVASGRSTENLSNCIGVLQTTLVGGVPIGNKANIQYSNIANATTNGSVVRGRFATISIVYGDIDDNASPPPSGTLGICLRDATANSLCPIFIRCIDCS